jgi:site-specific DNA-methyltransferase (adenine-specific)
VNYRSYKDKLPQNQYFNFMREVAEEVSRVLTPSGSVFLNIGHTSQEPLLDFEVASCWASALVLQNRINWVKSIAVEDRTHGHFKPVNSDRFMNRTSESIFHFSRSGNTLIDKRAAGVPYTYKCNIKRRGHEQDLRCAGSNWFIPYETVQAGKSHPAAFPEKLPYKCLLLAGVKSPVVCDPFLGSGTTLVAAAKFGATKGIGFDVDSAYLQIARNRVSEASAA